MHNITVTVSETTVAGALTSQLTLSTTISTFTLVKTTTHSGADWRVPCELIYGTCRLLWVCNSVSYQFSARLSLAPFYGPRCSHSTGLRNSAVSDLDYLPPPLQLPIGTPIPKVLGTNIGLRYLLAVVRWRSVSKHWPIRLEVSSGNGLVAKNPLRAPLGFFATWPRRPCTYPNSLFAIARGRSILKKLCVEKFMSGYCEWLSGNGKYCGPKSMILRPNLEAVNQSSLHMMYSILVARYT